MKIAVFGTGVVGRTIASKLASLGHDVCLGARDPNNEAAAAWAKGAGSTASHGSFAQAAAFGELIFNCTLGTAALDVLRLAGAENLNGKVLIDTSNPLDFSKGMPAGLVLLNDSVGEQIQHEFPNVKVVKALNTVNCEVMVDPSRVPGEHDIFMSGNDSVAKAQVGELLRGWFGWKRVIDLGDITTARGTEAYLALWLRLWGALRTGDFNVHVVHAP